jgi:hypothetical protein
VLNEYILYFLITYFRNATGMPNRRITGMRDEKNLTKRCLGNSTSQNQWVKKRALSRGLHYSITVVRREEVGAEGNGGAF